MNALWARRCKNTWRDGALGTQGRGLEADTQNLDLPQPPSWPSPGGLHSERRGFLLQNDDLIPQKLGAPNSLSSLLGLAGESIHGHFHKRVNSRLTTMHLGLCWHHWPGKTEKVKDESEGSQLPPCGTCSPSFLLFPLKKEILLFLHSKKTFLKCEDIKIYIAQAKKIRKKITPNLKTLGWLSLSDIRLFLISGKYRLFLDFHLLCP